MQITWLSTLQHFSNYKEFSLWSCHWCLTGRQKLCRHLKLHVSASHLHLAGKSRRLKKREWMILIISTGIMSMSVWAWYNGSPSQLQCEPLVKSISKVLSRGRTGEVQDRITLMRTSRDVWVTCWGKQTEWGPALSSVGWSALAHYVWQWGRERPAESRPGG